MNKKGVSNVLSTVIMISLVVILMVFLWGFVYNMVIDETEGSGDCYEAFEKLRLIDQYTCYNSSSKELYFAIGIDNLEIEKISINVLSDYTAKNFDLSYSERVVTGLYPYGGVLGNSVKLPEKESAQTYVLNLSEAGLPIPLDVPDGIEIFPEYRQKCQSADAIYDIEKCY